MKREIDPVKFLVEQIRESLYSPHWQEMHIHTLDHNLTGLAGYALRITSDPYAKDYSNEDRLRLFEALQDKGIEFPIWFENPSPLSDSQVGRWQCIFFSKFATSWLIQGTSCAVYLEKRPHYCNRGRWIAKVEAWGDLERDLDGQDGFPRYYFNLYRAKSEIEEWLLRREQLPWKVPDLLERHNYMEIEELWRVERAAQQLSGCLAEFDEPKDCAAYYVELDQALAREPNARNSPQD